MIGRFQDIFVLIHLRKNSNGRGGWSLIKEPKGEIYGLLLPATITEQHLSRNAENQMYDARAVVWRADSEFIDTETLIQTEGKTYKVIQIVDRNILSDYVDLLLMGEKGDGTAIYT